MANSVVMAETTAPKNNPWPKKTQMETSIEKAVVKNTRCFHCGTLVYAMEQRKTTNHIYHNRCFQCRICKRNLTGSTLNEEGDDIYCTNCFRKKQRGDCNSIQFRRAAAERAQYVYNSRHPDQPPPLSIPRPPIRHDLSRHPSWTLHQLERLFLSYQQPNTNDLEKNENSRKVVSVSHPLTIKTSFSTPVNLTNFRRAASWTKDEPSPSLHFSPVFSPFSSIRSAATTPKTSLHSIGTTSNDKQPKPIRKLSTGNESPLMNSYIKSTSNSSLSMGRKKSVLTDLNETDENTEQEESKFYFPASHPTTIRRRSASAKNDLNRRKFM